MTVKTPRPITRLYNYQAWQTARLCPSRPDFGPANLYQSTPVTNFPSGYALATAFVNGIPSAGNIVNLAFPPQISPPIIGFGVNGAGWTLNAVPGVSNNVLNLINGFDQGSSIFYDTPENIANFSASFIWQNTVPVDGGFDPA